MLTKQFSPFHNKIVVWWREWSLALFLLVALTVGGFSPRLFSSPKGLLFFELFIKDVLLVVVLICIFWFIHLLTPKPERLREFTLLNSLPVRPRQMALHFLMDDMLNYLWAPGITILLLFSLMPYAPISHIFRVSIFIFLLYTNVMTMSMISHCVLPSKKFNPLSTTHPIIAVTVVFLFLFLSVTAVLIDAALSGYSFWIFLISGVAVQILLIFFTIHFFDVWRRHHRMYDVPAATSLYTLKRSIGKRYQWSWPPLLIKNIIRIERVKTKSTLLLTAIFIFSGYLFSRNNERLDDFLAILTTTVIVYAIFFAFRTQGSLSPDSESTQLIFTLPIRRVDFYISTLLLPLLWMFLINLIFFLLALTTKVSAADAIHFWLTAFSLCAGIIVASVNFAFQTYPDMKSAQTRFLLWGLLYIVLMAIFFKYWYPIFLVLVGLSFIKTMNTKLYRLT